MFQTPSDAQPTDSTQWITTIIKEVFKLSSFKESFHTELIGKNSLHYNGFWAGWPDEKERLHLLKLYLLNIYCLPTPPVWPPKFWGMFKHAESVHTEWWSEAYSTSSLCVCKLKVYHRLYSTLLWLAIVGEDCEKWESCLSGMIVHCFGCSQWGTWVSFWEI